VTSAAVDERSAAIIVGIEAMQPQHVLILPGSTPEYAQTIHRPIFRPVNLMGG